MARIAPRSEATMAELDFDHYDLGHAMGHGNDRAARLSHMMNMAGAACSIALVIGLGIWGYKLAVRDVNGVPVIRALAGPMREMPQAPGGEVASHQGLSVNAVAAVGMAASLPEQVLLAPTPVRLATEDAAGLGAQAPAVVASIADPVPDPATMMPVQVGTSTISPIALSAPMADLPQDGMAEGALNQTQEIDTNAAVAMALADALASGAEPFAELASADVNDLEAPPVVRPRPRPSEARLTEGIAAAPVSDAAAVPAEIDPATLAVGTRLVQLGAFDNDSDARTEWTRLQAQFGDLLAEKAMVIQAAQSGGRTFYRLRAHGFADEDDARRFCAALVAENTPCIPALHR